MLMCVMRGDDFVLPEPDMYGHIYRRKNSTLLCLETEIRKTSATALGCETDFDQY